MSLTNNIVQEKPSATEQETACLREVNRIDTKIGDTIVQ
jgi:hypothetical protein